MFKLTPGDDHLIFEGEWLANFLRGGSPFVLQNLGLNLTLSLLLMKGEEKKEERGKQKGLA